MRDGIGAPAAAQAVHDRITGPMELMWLDTTNHIDLYDQHRFVDPEVERVGCWMSEHLWPGPQVTDGHLLTVTSVRFQRRGTGLR